MNFLKKIQEQPEHIRKIIFWTVVIIVGVIFLFTWIYSLKIKIEEAKQQKVLEQLKPPKFEEELNLPQVEMPEIPELSEEELKQLEEMLKESEQTE